METFLNAFRDGYARVAGARERWDDAQKASTALLGAVVNACPLGYGGAKAKGGSARALKSATGGEIAHYGKADLAASVVTAMKQRARVHTNYDVSGVSRPAWSASAANDAMNTVWFSPA